MLRVFKLIPIVFLGALFLSVSFTTQSYAQTCGGSIDSTCSTQQANPTTYTCRALCGSLCQSCLSGCRPQDGLCQNSCIQTWAYGWGGDTIQADGGTNNGQGYTCGGCNTYARNWSGTSCTYHNQYANTSNACYACVASDQTCQYGTDFGFCEDQSQECYSYTGYLTSPEAINYCGNTDTNRCFSGCYSPCYQGQSSCTTCQANEPYNTCGTVTGSQTCTHDKPQTCVNTNYTNSCSVTYNACDSSLGYTCGDNSLCRITRGGKITNSETGKGISGVTVSSYTSSNISATTDSNGNYTLPSSSTNGFAYNVQYTITAQNSGSVCTNYMCNSSSPKSSNPSSITFTTGGSGDCGSNCNFTFTPYHTITGEIYMDNNQNTCLDTGESGINFAANVTFTGPTTKTVAVNTTNGTFTSGNVLAPGVYTVSVSSTLPTGDRFKTAKSYQVTVGTGCSVANATTAKCQALNDTQPVCTTDGTNNVNNVVFGITDENATSGGMCADVRDDVTGGQYYNPIPATGYACGGVSWAYADFANGSCNNGAGIMFSCDGTFNFGSGQASAVNWQTDSTNPECFKPVNPHIIRTSYSYLESVAQSSNITPTDLSTICNISNCTLPSSGGYTTLPKGVYQVNGDLYLNATNFPANADPTKAPFNWIFLVNGNMYIQGNILVTPGSVVAFSVGANTTDVNKATKGNIYVDPCVGQTLGSYSDTQATSANNTNIQGLYSADQNFVIQSFTQVPGVCNQPATNTCNSDGTPVDKKLNILGSIVANAGQYATPGQVENQRDLCVFDKECPTYYYTPDPAELLNATLFLTHPLYSQHEVAP